jgi:beta-alanine degradation protein BauB
MKPIHLALPLGAAAGIACFVSGLAAQAPKPAQAPETATITFDNERTRVIEYRTNGGKNICGLGLHSHPPHAFIMITDAKLRVVTPDGKEEIIDAKAGEAGWEPAVTHRAENINGKDAACYLIEFKDKDWKPSTGLTAAKP